MVRTTDAGRQIHLSSVGNLRDLGGWPTRSSGVVRHGLVYRSAGLDSASDDDLAVLAGLRIRSVFDLRTRGEAAQRPDRVPAGAEHISLDVFADAARAAVVHQFDMLTSPELFEAALGGGRAEGYFAEGYRDMLRLDSATAAYRELFGSFIESGTFAALFHCTTGKDRTGWAAAALLLLLGVPEEDVYREYLLTNEQLLPHLRPVFEKFAANGGDPDELIPVLGVRREYLQAALDEMSARFGTIQNYFAEGLGLGADAQEELRALLTTG